MQHWVHEVRNTTHQRRTKVNRKEAQQLKGELDKALGKAQVLVAKSQHNADPGKNAELQHSLQVVLKDLERTLNLLSDARAIASDIAAELIGTKAQLEAERAEAQRLS